VPGRLGGVSGVGVVYYTMYYNIMVFFFFFFFSQVAWRTADTAAKV
jgi:hypothetical protein